MKKPGTIPLCRSQFLQDVTIALGRSQRRIRRANLRPTYEVSYDDNDAKLERLDIEARSSRGSLTKLTLWDDAMGWFYHCPQVRRNTLRENSFEVRVRLDEFDADQIASLISEALIDFDKVKASLMKIEKDKPTPHP